MRMSAVRCGAVPRGVVGFVALIGMGHHRIYFSSTATND